MFFRRYRSEVLITLAALAIAAAWIPIRMRFPFDDTYITFRYAANLAHGFGIVWNPGGAHTEGYTNFLFVLMLVPFSWLGWDLVLVSQVISVLAVVVSAAVIYRIVAQTSVCDPNGAGSQTKVSSSAMSATFCATFAVALFLLDPFTWLNAYSGMETSLFVMWLLLAVTAYRRPRLAFVFATLAALTRPEGAIIGGVLFAVIGFGKRTKGIQKAFVDLWSFVKPALFFFVIPLIIYALWKLWYFGNLLPNSFYVKVGQVSGETFLPGRGAMRIFYTGVWYFIPLATISEWRYRKNGSVQIAVLWCILLTGFYLFSQLIQNEYQRFSYSIEVMLMVLAGLSLMQIGTKGWTKCVAFSIVLALNIFFALGPRGGLGYIRRIDEEQNPYPKVAEVLRFIPDHEHITLAWGDAGRLPYFSGIQSLDPVGLNTNEIAHAHTAEEVVRFVIG